MIIEKNKSNINQRGLKDMKDVKNKEKFYITTAIAYASRKPHIGNVYEIILTDAIARYKRMTGCLCSDYSEKHAELFEIASCNAEAKTHP